MPKDSRYMYKNSTGDAVGAVADDSAVINAAGCAERVLGIKEITGTC